MQNKNHIFLVVAALFCTYFIWGSTYLAIRFGVESFPPFLMAGVRFTVAGLLMYGVLRLLGAPNPSASQWRNSGWVGDRKSVV